MPTPLLITGPAYDTGIPMQNGQKLINWYLEQDQAGGKHQLILRPTPGMTTFCTISGRSTIRGLIQYRGILYAIADHYLYSVSSAGVATLIGGLATTTAHTTTQVRHAAYGNQIIILDSGYGFVYNTSTLTLTQVADPDFPSNVSDVTVQDGYFIVSKENSENFYVSEPGDALTWDPLDVFESGANGDYLVAMVSDHKELWLLNSRSIEIWYQTADPNALFQRREGGVLNVGIVAARTLVQADNTLFWLSQDDSGQNLVMRANGYTPTNITNAAVAAKLSEYTTVSDAFAYTHRVGVHHFYVLTFPTEGKTWVYDMSNEQWHERQSYIGSDYTRHRGNCAAFCYSKSLVGDYQAAKIYQYSTTTYDEDGAILKRQRVTQPLPFQAYFTSIYDLEIDFEPGVGLSSGQGSDPQVMLRVSVDGGHTFGSALYRSLGAQGAYTKRARWDTLGYGRDWVFEITVTDPVNAVLLGATAMFDNQQNADQYQKKYGGR